MDPNSMPVSVRPAFPADDASRYTGFSFDATAQHFAAPQAHGMPPGASRDSHVAGSQLMTSYNALYGIPPSMPSAMPSSGLHQTGVLPAHDLYTPRPSITSLRHDSVVSIYRPDDSERNPVYRSAQFRQYRGRQEQRQDKEAAIWPPELENPFLDALLLIPIMGRKKYFMRHQQYGRNMLIGDYVWIAYVMGLPAGQLPDEKNMKRSRKQISSHIQVLKNFFKYHRYFHFFFPARDKESGKKIPGAPEVETVETISLKNNPVLVALSEGRFPDVRPNYDYFAQLLDQDYMVTLRPKTCHIFVSSHDVSIGPDKVPRASSGEPLELEDYPQLAQNLEGDGSRARSLDGGTLLHEYNRVIGQKESDTLKELVRGWEKTAPEIVNKLNLPEAQDEAPLTILEMSVSMELHRMNFPQGSELNGLVEMTIAAQSLQNHRWKCVTRLTRPRELCDSSDSRTFLEIKDEVGVQYVHQPGCGESGVGCDCMNRPRHDVRVPFPAGPWASVLTSAASYANRDGDARSNETTAEQLISKIVMVQELWSASTHPGHDGRWNRQALVMWRFNGAFKPRGSGSRHDVSASTSWRFLTVNDPTSDYHQQRAYISASQAAGMVLPEDSLISPTGPSLHHTAGNLGDGIPPVWSNAPIMRNIGSTSSHGSIDTTSDALSTNYSGAPTPPPTAGLYHSGFENHSLAQGLMSTGMPPQIDTSVASASDMVGSATSVRAQNQYMAPVGHSFNSSVCEPNIGGWDVTSSMDSWSQQQPGTGGSVSPYEPTILDKSGTSWQDDARDPSQSFWHAEPKAMWSSSVPQTSVPGMPGQHWDVRNPWDAGNRTNSFDKVSEAASPLTTLGKRGRDDGSEEDEKSPTDYQRSSHSVKRASLKDPRQLGLGETGVAGEW
ncbi:hypothetical protein BROUX41_001241 [Berkeleyomyces rouxiae]|uniref:uncharacterized protein n=1 Tax=Berkeleyomyces rouxiae TaxID=2035830 RepID=UPI003B7F9581